MSKNKDWLSNLNSDKTSDLQDLLDKGWDAEKAIDHLTATDYYSQRLQKFEETLKGKKEG